MTSAAPLLLALAAGPPRDVPTPDRPAVELRSSLSDDALAGDTAQGRSSGSRVRLQVLGTPRRSFQHRVFDAEGPLANATLRFGGVVGLDASTPSDVSRTDVDPSDRPYSGYTYGGLLVELSDGARNRLLVELDYGATGPQSGAGAAHRWLESRGGGPRPRGWDLQIRDELHFGLAASWDRELLRALTTRIGHLLDVRTHVRLELGERAIAGSGGASVRIGLLQRPFVGVPNAQADECRRAEGTCRPSARWQAFVYARADADLVLRRATIDGSIFDRPDDDDRSIHRADSRPFVPRGEVGVAVQPVTHVDLRFALQHTGPEVAVPGNRGRTTAQLSAGLRF